MKYLFLVNPAAGKGNLQNEVIDSINACFSENVGDYKIHITQCKGDAEICARRAAQSEEQVTVFACGGEGTSYEVLNGIIGFDNVRMGVIPCGSANDFLKFFKNREKFLDIACQIAGKTVVTDAIKAGDRYCLNGCSAGMDAIVAQDMSIFKKWPLVSGPAAYQLAIVKTFLRKIGIKMKISLDGGKPFDTDCLFAVVANGPCYGGGYTAAPNAVPFDGKLDFTLVKTISKPKIVKFLKLYKTGNHMDLDYCMLKNCTSMEFFADKPIPVNLDGEIITSKNMKFEIVKNAVKFVVPNGVTSLWTASEENILTKV